MFKLLPTIAMKENAVVPLPTATSPEYIELEACGISADTQSALDPISRFPPEGPAPSPSGSSSYRRRRLASLRTSLVSAGAWYASRAASAARSLARLSALVLLLAFVLPFFYKSCSISSRLQTRRLEGTRGPLRGSQTGDCYRASGANLRG
jgi:hypothetical protein